MCEQWAHSLNTTASLDGAGSLNQHPQLLGNSEGFSVLCHTIESSSLPQPEQHLSRVLTISGQRTVAYIQ